MKKADIAAKVQDFLGGTNVQATQVVNMVFDLIKDTMANGQDVDIAGFGKFSAPMRPAREARNPRTGETVKVPASRSPKFKAGKALKDAVKG